MSDKRKSFWECKLRKNMRSESGSAQVVEMSFVLPMAMGVVMSLIYLTFAMFLYVHLQGVAEAVADRITDAVISHAVLSTKSGKEEDFSDMYFLFSGEYLSDDEMQLIEDEFSQKLDNLCVLPGMSSDFRYFLEDNGLNPKIRVEMECSCFDGGLFTASVERKIYFPREFADNADLILEISEETGLVSFAGKNLERLRDACDEIF